MVKFSFLEMEHKYSYFHLLWGILVEVSNIKDLQLNTWSSLHCRGNLHVWQVHTLWCYRGNLRVPLLIYILNENASLLFKYERHLSPFLQSRCDLHVWQVHPMWFYSGSLSVPFSSCYKRVFWLQSCYPYRYEYLSTLYTL